MSLAILLYEKIRPMARDEFDARALADTLTDAFEGGHTEIVNRNDLDNAVFKIKTEMDARFAVVDIRFGALEKKIEVGFAEVNTKFASVDTKFAVLEKNMDVKFESIGKELAQLETKFNHTMMKSVGFIVVLQSALGIVLVTVLKYLQIIKFFA